MRLFLGFLGCICLLPLLSFAAPNDQPTDFRATHWGMSPDEVRASEKSKPKSDRQEGARSFLVYSDTVHGLACDVAYLFVKTKLVRTKYVVTETHACRSDFLADYQTLLSALKEKYGEPKEEQTVWKNDIYRNNPSEWGMALAVGDLQKFARWETERTSVMAIVTADNFNITLDVEYRSVSLRTLEQEVAKEEEAGKL